MAKQAIQSMQAMNTHVTQPADMHCVQAMNKTVVSKHEHEHEQLVTQHEVMQAKLCGSTCKPRKYSTCMYDNK